MAERKYSANEVRQILQQDIDSDDDLSEAEESSEEEDCIPTPVATDNDSIQSSSSSEPEMDESATKRPPRGISQTQGQAGRVAATGGKQLQASNRKYHGGSGSREQGTKRGRGSAAAASGRSRLRQNQTWQSKDGRLTWNSTPVKEASGRLGAQNVLQNAPGPTLYAIRNVDSPLSAFQLFMRSSVLQEIVKWTNKEGSLVYGENWKDVTDKELLCFLGLSILSGVYKSRNESIQQLWSLEDGRPIFNRGMARNRFQQISRAMRFDDAIRRKEHRDNDKLAPIRRVFESWESTLQDSFVPDENVTVDEQLLTYRGRVPFKQYIPSKPGKYGIKLWMLCDSKTSYVCRLQVYTGDKKARKGNRTRVNVLC